MTLQNAIELPEDRYFDPNPEQKQIALELYRQVADLPLICPHGHVDPKVFADPDYSFGTPADLIITPDHYVFRMLYSQGIPMESLGLRTLDGSPVEQDPRKIWQTFADNFYLFRGTPTGMWLNDELALVFGVDVKLASETAREVYDTIEQKLAQPEFRPRRLYERFNIEVLDDDGPGHVDPGGPPGHPGFRLGRAHSAHLPARRRREYRHTRVASEHRRIEQRVRRRHCRLWQLC